MHVFGLREESSETTHECYYIISSSWTAMMGPAHDASVRFRATCVSNPPSGHRSAEETKSHEQLGTNHDSSESRLCDLAEQSGGKADPDGRSG